jgi:RimJ/RimL family protein N-acetyltransferase
MARSLGVARIELAVLAENEPAARFYARRGYHDRVTLTAKRFDE